MGAAHNNVSAARPRRLWVIAFILVAIAGPMLVLGTQLLMLGGSAYYLLCGGALLAAAILFLWRSRWAGYVLAGVLLATLGWSLLEAGLNFWALVARLLALTILVLVLSLPFAQRPLAEGPKRKPMALLLASVGVVVAVLIVAYAIDGTSFRGTDVQRGEGGGRIEARAADWPFFGSDERGQRYSPLGEITPANVGRLEEAWRFSFGASPDSFETSPLKIGNSVYVCSDTNVVAAVDATTGAELWRFDPQIEKLGIPTCRGVAHYRVPEAMGRCSERIFTITRDARLIALDAADGKPCPGFGNNGSVSLLEGMGPLSKGQWTHAGAPTVAAGRVILGGMPVSPGPSGVIRAYDAVTGALSWAFDAGRPDEHGLPPDGQSYTPRTPNAWAPMSADEAAGLLYVPVGGAKPPYYGVERRPFDEAIATAVIALDLETGGLRWAFQTVHHDLWDYDVGSQPLLADLDVDGKIVPALIQPTKRGQIFVLNRLTGKPVFRVVERPVPQAGKAPEERLSPTQPYSIDMPSLAGEPLTEAMMWGLTPIDQLLCRIRFREARYEGEMTPPGETPSIAYPGYIGGMNWGGASLDPGRSILVTPTVHLANQFHLRRATAGEIAALPPGAANLGAMSGPFFSETDFFLSPLDVPCQQPPWGRLSAIDLNSKKLLWSQPLGTAQALGPLGIPSMLPLKIGVPAVGGSVVTRSGLTFIAASTDRTIRAFRTATGEELWNAPLPHSGISAPISYTDNKGRQVILIAAGGKKWLAPGVGDTMIAYRLPDDR